VKYRIVETTLGDFVIQREVEETTGHLWWRRTGVSWVSCNVHLQPVRVWHLPPPPDIMFVKHYETVGEAEGALERYMRGARVVKEVTV
jgi:hypothetical protein